MSNLGVSDTEFAQVMGVSRQTMHKRRTGRVSMTADDLHDMARALDVDPALFMGDPVDAVRWLTEHRSAQFRCTVT
jgi:transcriptional regulator with XRE-family HTH domain